MLRSYLVAVLVLLVIGPSIPAFAISCEEACLNVCATKELAPGLYRGECQSHCNANCYRTRSEKNGAAEKNCTNAGNCPPGTCSKLGKKHACDVKNCSVSNCH